MQRNKSNTKISRFSARNYARSKQFNSKVKRLILEVKQIFPNWQACLPLACLIVLGWCYVAVAQTPAPTVLTTVDLKNVLATLGVAIAAFLVFFMNSGFCMLETGFCRQKNAVNVLSKNLMVLIW